MSYTQTKGDHMKVSKDYGTIMDIITRPNELSVDEIGVLQMFLREQAYDMKKAATAVVTDKSGE